MLKAHTLLIYILGVLFSLICLWAGIRTGFLWLSLFPVLALLGIASLSRPGFFFYGSIVLYASTLKFPYLPQKLSVTLVLQAAFIAVACAGKFIRKSPPRLPLPLRVVVVLFVGNILMILFFRGTGFQVLGDRNWGGFRYIPMLMSALFLLMADFMRLEPRKLRRSVVAMLLLSMVPAFMEGLTLVSGGRLVFQYHFFQVGGGTAMSYFAQMGDALLVRFQAAKGLAEALMVLALVYHLQKPSGLRRYVPAVMILAAFLASGISGHRLSMFSSLALLLLFGAIKYKQQGGLLLYVVALGIGSLMGVTLLYMLAEQLPYAVQRSISFLPGIRINQLVDLSAASSTEWRLQMWGDAIREIPHYLWLGKGFTYPQYAVDYVEIGPQVDPLYQWAITTSTYHNGVLSLLIGLGLPGLVLGVLFFIFVIHRHLRYLDAAWRDPLLRALHYVLFLLFLVETFIFFVVYGDAPTGFAERFFKVAVLECLVWAGVRRGNGIRSPDPGASEGAQAA